MPRTKQCRRTRANGSTSAKVATRSCAQNRAIVVCSARSVRCRALQSRPVATKLAAAPKRRGHSTSATSSGRSGWGARTLTYQAQRCTESVRTSSRSMCCRTAAKTIPRSEPHPLDFPLSSPARAGTGEPRWRPKSAAVAPQTTTNASGPRPRPWQRSSGGRRACA